MGCSELLMLLAIAGAGITYKVLVDERDTARATVAADVTTIKTLGSQIDALQAAQVSLEQHIAVQDSSIATMKKDSSDAQQRATDAMHTASQQSKKDASTIATLQKRAADPTNKGTCDAELYRIRTGL